MERTVLRSERNRVNSCEADTIVCQCWCCHFFDESIRMSRVGFFQARRLKHRDDQRARAVGRQDIATVPVALFPVVFVQVDHGFAAQQFGVVLDVSEVGGRKDHGRRVSGYFFGPNRSVSPRSAAWNTVASSATAGEIRPMTLRMSFSLLRSPLIRYSITAYRARKNSSTSEMSCLPSLLLSVGISGGYRGVERTVFLADGQRQQLFVQVIQIVDQMQGVFQMAVFLLAFFAQQVYQIHVPEENLLFFGFVQFAFLHQLRIDRFGTELQGA